MNLIEIETMATTLSTIREKISARLAVVFIITIMSLLWSFGHINVFAAITLGLSAAFLLFQMEVKYRRKELKNKRKYAQAE